MHGARKESARITQIDLIGLIHRAEGVVRNVIHKMFGVIMKIARSPLQRHSPNCLMFDMLPGFPGGFLNPYCFVNNDSGSANWFPAAFRSSERDAAGCSPP